MHSKSQQDYRYSPASLARLGTCDDRLIAVFNEVIKHVDCTIISGRRGEEEQNELVRTGKSELEYPDSKHNSEPRSEAVDAAPHPIDWKDRERATLFAGFVIGIAKAQGVTLRWGGDWDSDFQVNDNNFDDLWHFEIVEA